MQIKGIDISIYNLREGPIDWTTVHDSGVEFVMVRLGWAGFEGELHLDDHLAQTVDDAAAAGLSVGLYLYSYIRSEEAARKAAQAAVEFAKDHQILYPIALDVEDKLVVQYLNKAQLTGTVTAFCSELEHLGYYAMYYTNKSYAETFFDLEELRPYDFWLAQYAEEPTYSGEFGMWQYVGGEGRCPGVTGPCDRDLAFKDYAQIIRDAGLNGTEAKPDPEPEEKAVTVAQLKEMGYTSISLE